MSHAATSGPVSAGNCATCHSGTYLAQNAQTKPATHIATTEQCDTCHSSTTTWATATFNHASATPAVAGRCSSCHNSVNALGRPTNHIPTTAQCDTCHTSFAAFAPSTMSHAGTTGPASAGNCATCHSGSYVFANALAKPATHVTTSAQCDTCHSGTTTWAGATFNHATATPTVTGRCASCHDGSQAPGKPTVHIPTTAQCDTCHKSYVVFAPSTMSHAATSGPVSAGNCATCHSGTYLAQNAQTKPATHIATTEQCDTCHSSTTTWATATFNHATATPAVAGRCSSCHNSVNALGRPTNHIPTTAQCDTCHKSFSAFAPSTMSHAGTTGPASSGNCATCHSGSYVFANALAKPATHVATTAQCDTCHTSTTTWAGATFNHATATPTVTGRCASCHDGSQAPGKPTVHVPTTAQCDSCHVTGFARFAPATMSHAATTGPVSASNCATCHSGTYVAQNAQTKPGTHVATTAQCDTCHNSTTTWATATFNHASATPAVAGRCASCHNGTQALGKPTNHIPTTAQCDTCHTGFAAFAPATMSHAGTTGPVSAGNCATCHSGMYVFANALAKPATHIATAAQCDSCHNSTVSWAGAAFVHDATAAGRCASCHNGTQAPGKPTVHIPTTAQCDTCHKGFSAFAPATMSHAATTGPVSASNCATCHSGTYVAQNAQTKPATHIATTAQCDTCHSSMTTWATATFNHASATPAVAGRCASCHNGTQALGRPTNHIPTTAQCDTCHTGFAAFAPSTMSHAGTTGPASAGNCATCHSGSYVFANALAKPATHVATTAQCDTCHTSTTTWAGATFNHATATPTVTGRCASCHNGSQAPGKPTVHVPTTAQCDTCHVSGFARFAPATMSHAGTTGPVSAGNCATCHSGTYLAQNAQTKPATHVATTAQCDTCHRSTTTWATVTFNHATATPPVAGRCASCHNGTQALGKPTNHIPTTAQCDTCHKSFAAFAPATMSHAATTGPVSAGNCASCHSGTYVYANALAKPATHVATTAQCDTCHNSTTTWASATFNHATATPPVTGRCSSCHNGTQAPGKPTVHIPTTAQCDTCHKSYVVFAPSTMSHAGTTGPVTPGNCIICHSGTYLAQNAQTKPATHIVTTAQCDSCHTSTTTWATVTFNHATATPPVAGRCASCHNGTQALGKPTNHIPTTAQCDTCHKSFSAFAPSTMSHAATTGPSVAGNCATCHGGAYVFANALAKPATHIATTQSCDVCHTTLAWKPTSFSHAGVAPGSCASCHNGTQAQGKPTVHIPTSQSCDSCHRVGLAWLPLITPYSHTGVAPGTCANCHSPTYPGMDVKPASHLPTTAACDACHHSFSAWTPATFNHAGVAPGTCQSCHGGSYQGVVGKPANHIPTVTPSGMPGNECSLCHSSTTSFGTERMNHGTMQTSCIVCHDSSSNYQGRMDKINRSSGDHRDKNAAGKDCSSAGCHRPLGTRGTPYTRWTN